jgi:hypothetical protein
MIRAADALEPFREVLIAGEYTVEIRPVENLGPVLLAETEHALVLCLACSWEDAVSRAEEAQAVLTRLATEHPSPRTWDLYVVVAVEDTRDAPERKELEFDTRYARKLVAVGVGDSPQRAERALRPLLPLRGAAALLPIDPLEALRTELLDQDVDTTLVDAAITSFSTAGKVVIP